MNIKMNALKRLAPDITTSNLLKNNIWNNHSRRSYIGQTYEGTGKTTGYIVNKKGADSICIDYVSPKGFELVNGWKIKGSTVFFRHTFLSWNVQNFYEVNEDSLALFTVLQPQMDVLLLGCGDRKNMTFQMVKNVMALCKKLKLKFEIMPTDTAAATFNFCSLDRRLVAAALIPPTKIVLHEKMDLVGTRSNPETGIVRTS